MMEIIISVPFFTHSFCRNETTDCNLMHLGSEETGYYGGSDSPDTRLGCVPSVERRMNHTSSISCHDSADCPMLTQQYNNAMLETRNIGVAKRISLSMHLTKFQ